MNARLEELIQRYLAMAEGGVEPDSEELLREAGEDSDALRRWITSHQAVRQVRDALTGAGTVERDTTDGNGFAHFRDLQAAGSGGMATVYRAWDSHLERTVALKILNSERMP